jgi:hypothetical protein
MMLLKKEKAIREMAYRTDWKYQNYSAPEESLFQSHVGSIIEVA